MDALGAGFCGFGGDGVFRGAVVAGICANENIQSVWVVSDWSGADLVGLSKIVLFFHALADRRCVAGQFGIAATGKNFSISSSLKAACTLPVADLCRAFELEFLIEKQRLNFSRKLEGWNGDFPAGRISGSAGSFPLVDGCDGKVG